MFSESPIENFKGKRKGDLVEMLLGGARTQIWRPALATMGLFPIHELN
jgi:hypothetical protein